MSEPIESISGPPDLPLEHQSAFPIPATDRDCWTPVPQLGMTKREYFASLALAGLLNNPAVPQGGSYPPLAVKMADGLLLALAETPCDRDRMQSFNNRIRELRDALRKLHDEITSRFGSPRDMSLPLRDAVHDARIALDRYR